jgi:hypothetical protein
VGTNKRYAHVVGRRVGERIIERAAADGPLQRLTDAELELDRLPLTIDPRPAREGVGEVRRNTGAR